jgi:hypothetical protein
MVPSLSSAHEDFEEVEEGIHPTAKYSSFTAAVHSSAWGIDETKRFYEVDPQPSPALTPPPPPTTGPPSVRDRLLSHASLLPKANQKATEEEVLSVRHPSSSLRLTFLPLSLTREENHHPELIKATLNSQVPLDLAPFEVHLGTIMPEDYEQRFFSELPYTEPPASGIATSPPSSSTAGLLLLPPVDDSELVDV